MYNSKINIKKKYQRRTIITFFVFLFLFSSNFIFKDNSEAKGIETGTELVQSGVKVTYVYSEYSVKNHEIAFAFSMPLSDIDPLLNYTLSVKADKKTNDDLPVRVTQLGSDKYIAFVENVPKKWKKMSVQVITDSEENSNSETQGFFYLEKKSVLTTSNNLNKDVDSYAVKFEDAKIKNIEKIIDEIEKQIAQIEKENNQLLSSNKELLKATRKEVGEELETIESKIASNQQRVESNKKDVEELEVTIKDNESRIKKIKEVE